ncbi:hypothetical protein ScPMuIL_018717 [Solemya velum]
MYTVDFRHHPMSSPTLVTVPGWVLVILLVYVSQVVCINIERVKKERQSGKKRPNKEGTRTNSHHQRRPVFLKHTSLPANMSRRIEIFIQRLRALVEFQAFPVVRMCEDSTVTSRFIALDASSAEHVSATQCRCTLLVHGDDRVWFNPYTVPGYTGCGTSIEVTSTGGTARFGCEESYNRFLELNSGSTTNITLNKPATLSQSNAVDHCVSIYIADPKKPKMTVRCWSPNISHDANVGEMTVSATNTQKPTTAIPNFTTESTAVTPKDKSATTTDIPDKTSTPTLGYTSSGQDCKQTTSDEKFPVEIVVPVVVVAVVFCVATIVGSVIYVRRHTDSIRNPTYDRHANTAAHDMHFNDDREHVYRRPRERFADVNVSQRLPFGGGSAMVWDASSFHNQTPLTVIDGNLAPPVRSLHGPALPTRDFHGSALPTRAFHGPALPTRAFHSPALPTRDFHGPALPTRDFHGPALPTRDFHGPALPTRDFHGPALPTRDFHGPALPTRDFHGPALPTRDFHGPALPTRDFHGPALPTRDFHGPAVPARGFQSPAPVGASKV